MHVHRKVGLQHVRVKEGGSRANTSLLTDKNEDFTDRSAKKDHVCKGKELFHVGKYLCQFVVGRVNSGLHTVYTYICI